MDAFSKSSECVQFEGVFSIAFKKVFVDNGNKNLRRNKSR